MRSPRAAFPPPNPERPSIYADDTDGNEQRAGLLAVGELRAAHHTHVGCERSTMWSPTLAVVNRSAGLFELPKIVASRGNLSFLEEDAQVPFQISRVYWLHDVPGGEVHGGHAFRKADEIIVALSGSVDVLLNDGTADRTYSLNRAYVALHVPRMHWRELRNFSTNSLVLIVASTEYDEADYIWDFDEFCALRPQ